MHNISPQHRQSVSLCDALDRVLHTGVVALGEVTISVADVDLLYLGLQLVITSIETGREPAALGNDWPASGRVVQGGPGAEWSPKAGPVVPFGRASSHSSSLPLNNDNKQGVVAATLASNERKSLSLDSGGQASKKNGLGQLVLTLVKVLHELLKRQAVRRMEAGSLSPDEMERLGVTLMRQSQEIERLANDLGLKQEDLNLDLGPLGKLL
jgi:hypothetical protein